MHGRRGLLEVSGLFRRKDPSQLRYASVKYISMWHPVTVRLLARVSLLWYDCSTCATVSAEITYKQSVVTQLQWYLGGGVSSGNLHWTDAVSFFLAS